MTQVLLPDQASQAKQASFNALIGLPYLKPPSVIRFRHMMPSPPNFHYVLDLSTSRPLVPRITFHQQLPNRSTQIASSINYIKKKVRKSSRYPPIMISKRKSVTFREQLSDIYPNSTDGSLSPATTTTSPTSLDLDPMYLTWLRSATKAQYPFIIDGTFGKQIYHQNFNIHQLEKSPARQQMIPVGEAACSPLAEKYGSLGWGSLYKHVNTEAWVKNYRVRGSS